MKLKDIRPNPNNPRIIRDARFEKLKRSIEQFPKMMNLRPIVVDASGVILGGNMRLKALQDLGFKEIPDEWVRRADDLTEEEKQRFIIADNVGFGEWDWDTLANEWDAGDLDAWGLDVPGFETIAPEAEDDGYEMPDDIETDIVPGDLFEIGPHRLLCGDSTDSDAVARLMTGEKADMVFTDPDFSMPIELLKEVYSNALLFSSGFGFWICGDKQAVQLAMHDFDNFTHFFVQDFKAATLTSNTQAMTKHVIICKFGSRKMNNLKDGFSTILSIATARMMKDHKQLPMQKRVELPAEFISHYTDAGNIVLDLFGHSGSTMAAAEQLGRKCYMMELEPKYCQSTVDRMKILNSDLIVLKNGTPIA